MLAVIKLEGLAIMCFESWQSQQAEAQSTEQH
jgi:hypothetical protein